MTLSIKCLDKDDDGYGLRLQYPDAMTREGYSKAMAKLIGFFPQAPKSVINTIVLEAKELGWTDREFMDRVNYVGRKYPYPVPSFANLNEINNRVKLLTHYEYCCLDKAEIKHYKSVRVPGMKKPLWASEADIATYQLELYSTEK